MSIWRNIASLAGRRSVPAVCAECPPGPPGGDPAFAAAVTALGAKLAKADGVAQQAEYDTFSEIFAAEAESARDVRRLYELARQTTHGFESYARRLAKRYRACPNVLEAVLDGLFHIAGADGAVTSDEMAYLERVAEIFLISPLTVRRLKAVHLGLSADDPYAVLGVAPDATDDDLKIAWRRALVDAHPDKARGLGLPEPQVARAEARSAAINAAYDAAVRERRALEAVGAPS